jgi:hypothetical protein
MSVATELQLRVQLQPTGVQNVGDAIKRKSRVLLRIYFSQTTHQTVTFPGRDY